MFGFPTQWRYVKAPATFFILIIVLELLKPISFDLLGFIPKLIENGELWRLITGQVLHSNLNHMLLNIAGLTLVWALHGEYYSAKHYTSIVLISLVFVGIALGIVYTNIIYYGLSGIIHSLLIYGAIIDISKHRKSGWLLVLGVWAKVYYELTSGASSQTAQMIGASVAVEAHFIGACVGSLLGPAYLIINRKSVICS